MKVLQILPTLSYGDAVGNDTRAIGALLKEMGYETQIYAENIDPRLPNGEALPFNRLPKLSNQDVVLYHGSVGSSINYQLSTYQCKKIMRYHNVTPPAFFHSYSETAEYDCEEGYRGMKHLSDKLDFCIAVSEYNKGDLLRMGYTCPIETCPILIPFSDYEAPPDQSVIKKYSDDGYTNIVFVGRVAPNKKHENVIRAFYCYHKYFNPKSRLFLVGGYAKEDRYYQRLYDYVQVLGISDCVIFTGHIKFNAILAYYKIADVFLCMSEHEGFCVPLVEAMYFDVPIVAYRSSAIPDTLGGSGVLLDSNDPIIVAEAVDKIVKDQEHRTSIIQGQKKRLDDFSYEKVAPKLKRILKQMIEGIAE